MNSAEREKPRPQTVELTILLKELKSSLNCFSDQETPQKDFDVMHERTLLVWLGSPFQLDFLTPQQLIWSETLVCSGALWVHTTLRSPRKKVQPFHPLNPQRRSAVDAKISSIPWEQMGHHI